MRKVHDEVIIPGRKPTLKSLGTKTAKEIANAVKVRRAKTFAMTGNTANIRPLLKILLLKRGFLIREYPARGIRGLICGDAHTLSR
jgi:hypothetical protein